MGHIFEYPIIAGNKVNRKGKDRGKYDLGTVHRIINNAMILNVSFAPSPDDDFPAILPMIGVMASFSRPSADIDEPLDCYLHGYVSSRIMNLTRKAVAEGKKGLPVCVAASKVDGLIIALTPNAHSLNYRSAVIFGHANLVHETDEKLFAMELITNKVVPGRWSHTRLPPNGSEMQSTQILRITIERGSAKIRDQGPHDYPVDVNNDQVLDTVWAGYMPMTERFEDPVPAIYNRVTQIPEHITEYKKNFNEEEDLYVEKMVKAVRDGI
jgi:nitroimidazol reductase NimA-like FMN-containing flavoprotein (pyridoxamine 5'-phosphate oxidase superfamily)